MTTLASPRTGFAWNGVYGAVDVYPQYGAYQATPPVPVPSASPSYVIDVIDTSQFAEFAVEYGYIRQDALDGWIFPWVENRLILGRMARWKAIFLLNGYDKVWSILQNLRVLSSQPLLPTPTLDQDGTIANGDWSTRELFSILNFSGDISAGPLGSYSGPGGALVFETPGSAPLYLNLSFLVGSLYNIAKSSWGGSESSVASPIRPIGFRDMLAAAAV
jgi:hypothetical protein